MALSGTVTRLLKKVAAQFGYVVLHQSTADEIVTEYPWLGSQFGMAPADEVRSLPPPRPGAPSASDPKIANLQQRYAGHPATAHTVWSPRNLKTELAALERFREDNAYVWQTRANNPIQYLLAASYVKDHDPLRLYPRLQEDAEFGAYTFQHDGRSLSRDLLDSIMEISFLEDQIGLSRLPNLTVLDIGAGYGRLAHRMAEALPNLTQYFCADAVPESTFVSAYYTKFRGVDDKVRVVPLDEVEAVVESARIDVAVNIHSFSECSLASIEYWLGLIQRARVPWLFVIPNTGARLISSEADGSRVDFLPAITSRGYTLATERPKYHLSPETQRYGLFPATYFLFKRTG